MKADVSCGIVKVGKLDRGGDLESRDFGQVAGRKEWGAGFGSDVAGDCTGFVENEPVVLLKILYSQR
jgi:hypothetical protein